MTDTPLHRRDALQIAEDIREGRTTAVEALAHFRDRVERLNPPINAVIAHDFDGAEEAAEGLDKLMARGYCLGPFHGVPMTVKESYDLTGYQTTWGDPALKGNIAATDAVLVERIKRAGANVFGKTNVPLNLTDWQSYNDVYGGCGNPWDPSRTPGGSSGGSAATLAAGMTGLEFGSDIGASVRNPAHFCGVFGHKPTYGIVPKRGHWKSPSMAPSDIAVCGPLARSARDLEAALLAVAGDDPVYGAGWELNLPKPDKDDLGDFRVALMTTSPVSDVEQEYQDALHDLADRLRAAGATVDEREPFKVDWELYHLDYFRLFRPVTHSRLPPEKFKWFQDEVAKLSDDDDSYFAMNARAGTITYYDWAAADTRRYEYRDKWNGFFRDYDLLLCPQAACAAFPRNEDEPREVRKLTINGKEVGYNDQLFWAGISGAVYLPGTVAPIGLGRESGLPLGVQIVGPFMGDLTTIRFARLIEEAFGGVQTPPGFE
ncbi:MAG: amidase [Minwuia sp.]|uniref:amidase n=1 Tax=Minwuia sp. TaxID=2493630 RepID=UPI003A8B5E60